MKSLVISLVLLAVFGSISARLPENGLELDKVVYQQRIMEGTINDTINNIVGKLKPYDPIDIKHLAFELLGHTFLIEDANLGGFSNIHASHIKLSGLITWTFELVIDIGRLAETVGHWKVDGAVFYGEGRKDASWDNAKLSIVVTLNPITMNVKSAQITPHVTNTK
ncbi:hypothetical protein ILUMI_22024, partial [Ignelater luminosus]